MTLTKVISGAQIGADIAGLRAAHTCGLLTGGWMPLGWKTRHGQLPSEDRVRFNLQETTKSDYPTRTRYNVRDSDGTIQLAYDWESPGERLTTRLIKEYGQPSFQVPIHAEDEYRVLSRPTMIPMVVDWIQRNNIETLNVAGNGNVDIELCVEAFLVNVFRQLKD